MRTRKVRTAIVVVGQYREQYLEEILAIEAVSFPEPWTKRDFVAFKESKTHLIQVATFRGVPAGYVCFNERLQIMNLAVAEDMRRRGVGFAMIKKLKNAIEQVGGYLSAVVSERNVGSQLFFRSQGFECFRVIPEHYGIPQHDGYQMVWKTEKVASP